MPSRTSPRRTTGERGAAMVEFAIVLPLMVVLVFGTIDIGRAYMAWNQVKGAAREGAGYAQFFPNRATNVGICVDPDNVRFKALQEGDGDTTSYSVSTKRVDPPQSTITCGGTAVPPGAKVRVTVSQPFEVITPIASRLVGNPLVISASVEVVVQG